MALAVCARVVYGNSRPGPAKIASLDWTAADAVQGTCSTNPRMLLPRPCCCASRQRDALDLDVDRLGQLLHGDTAAGRLMGKPLGILLVHILTRQRAAVLAGSTPRRARTSQGPYLLTAKKAMSARKMLTLTTFSIEEPASSRTAFRFLMQAAVLSWMVPSTGFPSLPKGIWPEQ